jgi:hypothetical protein
LAIPFAFLPDYLLIYNQLVYIPISMAQKENPSSANPFGIVGPDGKPIEIPAEGSLGLLAVGYRGLMAWRQKRKEVLEAKKKAKSE